MTIQDLKNQDLILLEVISGSRAYDLATVTSDTDIRGVFYLPKDKFYGLEYIPQISNESNDIVYYELGRFVELLIKNNPTILELLASPDDCVLYKHPIMDLFKQEDFVSKLCKDTFAGYAITQIKKARGLNKKMLNPIAKERKTILDFCYILQDYSSIALTQWMQTNQYKQQNCGLVNIPHSKGMYALFYSDKNSYKGIMQKENANEVSVSNIPQGEVVKAYMHFNQDGYSVYCKEYKEYWEWIEKRNEDRYHENQQHGQNYDSKNMMHTIRLLQTAKSIFEKGKIEVRVNNRDELLAIKAGKKSYDELLTKAESLISDIETSFLKSSLQEMPSKTDAENLLIGIRNTLYS